MMTPAEGSTRPHTGSAFGVRWGGLFLLLMLLGGSAVWLTSSHHAVKPQPVRKNQTVEEVSLMTLVRTNGLFFKSGQTNPFSGAWIGTNSDGVLLSRTQIKEGRIHGLSEGWYTNGVLQVREHFVNGLEDGLREKWYFDGTRMLRGMLVAGKFEGEFERWHTNGVLSEKMTMRNGKPDGLASSYYPSGNKKKEVIFSGGAVISDSFWQDGEAEAVRTSQKN